MRDYTLQSNPDYGWFTGRTKDANLALMGIDLDAMVCVLFDAEGRYHR